MNHSEEETCWLHLTRECLLDNYTPGELVPNLGFPIDFIAEETGLNKAKVLWALTALVAMEEVDVFSNGPTATFAPSKKLLAEKLIH